MCNLVRLSLWFSTSPQKRRRHTTMVIADDQLIERIIIVINTQASQGRCIAQPSTLPVTCLPVRGRRRATSSTVIGRTRCRVDVFKASGASSTLARCNRRVGSSTPSENTRHSSRTLWSRGGSAARRATTYQSQVVGSNQTSGRN